jgi:hypothetical protein
MGNIKYIIMLISICFCFDSFAQGNKCTGEKYNTDASSFRAYSNSSSIDMTASRKKALSNARNAMSAQISKTIERTILQQNIEQAYQKKAIELSMITIRQEIANVKVICEDCYKKGPKYTCEMVVELPKDRIKESIAAQIQNDNTLKDRFNIEKFKNAL